MDKIVLVLVMGIFTALTAEIDQTFAFKEFFFSSQLHSPEFLQSPKLPAMLKNVHAAKQRKLTGRELYEMTLEPTLLQHTAISARMKTMLW